MRHVLYHNDTDGFGAAYAIWRAFRYTTHGLNTDYHGVQYGGEIPEAVYEDDRAHVICLDYCPPAQALADLVRHAQSTIVIDHHETAKTTLRRVSGHEAANKNLFIRPRGEVDYEKNGPELTVRIDFDNDTRLWAAVDTRHSAAVLAWKHYHPGRSVPHLLQYVEDRDLWKFEMYESRAINYAIRTYPKDFNVWRDLEEEVGDNPVNLVLEGIAVERHVQRQIRRIGAHAEEVPVMGHVVPVVACNFYQSEMADYLFEEYPDAPFAAVIIATREGKQIVSLRANGPFKVGKLAERLGGGGHDAAAAFTIDSTFTKQITELP